ncbi:MAG: DUF4190 domain-containing protein [Blastocatellia bacterium]|nr:DUF4190 domain-containing protein [Blastocatellia bacterium]
MIPPQQPAQFPGPEVGYQTFPPPSQPQFPPYPPPGFGAYPMPPQVRQGAGGKAIASLVLGICSFALGLGPVLSIPGVILGKMEMNAIRRGEASPDGETIAKVGFYVSLLNIILTGILLLVILTFCAALIKG